MRKIITILLLILLISIMCSTYIYADSITDPKSVTDSMSGATANNMASGESSGIPGILNTVIGLLQVAGTGISIIVVSLLGIKYLMASPSEKADTKKSILPIIIGCVLLFGAVNLMSAVFDFTTKAFT